DNNGEELHAGLPRNLATFCNLLLGHELHKWWGASPLGSSFALTNQSFISFVTDLGQPGTDSRILGTEEQDTG
ncbi:MAG: hypothetical protein Q8O00_01240, partial [Holophaga sp.]|nr:hypothetical protein [Holophaga sp.]